MYGLRNRKVGSSSGGFMPSTGTSEEEAKGENAQSENEDETFCGLLKINVVQARNVSRERHVVVALFTFLIAPPLLYTLYLGEWKHIHEAFPMITNGIGLWFAICLIQMINVLRTGTLGALVWDNAFVVISFGLDTFRTNEAAGKSFPLWNECIPLVVKNDTLEYKVNVSVYSKKLVNSNKMLCSSKLSIRDLLEIYKHQSGFSSLEHSTSGLSELEEIIEKHSQEIDTDRASESSGSVLNTEAYRSYQSSSSLLLNASRRLQAIKPGRMWIPLQSNLGSSRSNNVMPELEVNISFISSDILQRRFWEWVLQQFDESNGKQFSKIELGAIFEAIGSNITDSQLDEIFGENETLELNVVCELLIRNFNLWTASARSTSAEKILPIPSFSSMASALPRKLSMDSNLSALSSSSPEFATCPLCAEKLPQSHAEMVIHMATCVEAVTAGDKFAMNGLITEANASRGWFKRLGHYLTDGRYRLGAKTGNILVQRRETGELIEEKIPSYIRLSLRVLYQTSLRATLGSRTLKLFKHLTQQQGAKFDSPESVAGIKAFIRFYDIETEDVEKNIADFKTFNEFFYRRLKPGARTAASPLSTVALSPADSRCVVYPHHSSATEYWVKGQNFTYESMLGDASLAKKMGPMAIFRLAPQDYHRFHIPVNGRILSHKKIEGQYYTVNPMAVRENVDVFTENVRTVTLIDSPEFGLVAYICVGAMMVGSIVLTVKEGAHVTRMDECGYFAFGGSTVILLFEHGAIEFDKDLVDNSRKSIETLVRVGASVGITEK